MAEAVYIHEAYKKFGNTETPFWKRIIKGNGKNIGSDRKNGQKPFVVAVDHVSFSVSEGEIFGVLGPNGSGKSTLIRLLATLLLPDGGDIRVFGHDVVRHPMQVQRLINRVSVEASFFKKLSPMEEMSRGMQQKVAIARALLSRPSLLLLDEPTTGLDPRSKREVQDVIRELRDDHGTTILLTTHDMLEADNLCDRIAIIDSGKIVALDTPPGLKKLISSNEHEPTLEDVFLELTGKELVKEEDRLG